MSKITFDTDDYYDDVELKEMVEEETRSVIRSHVKDMLCKNAGLNNFIYNVAAKTVSSSIDDEIPDYKDVVRDGVREAIEGLTKFDVFYYSENAHQIIDEAVEEFRPMIRAKAKEIVLDKVSEQVNAEQIVDYVCEEFYNVVRSQLIGDEK